MDYTNVATPEPDVGSGWVMEKEASMRAAPLGDFPETARVVISSWSACSYCVCLRRDRIVQARSQVTAPVLMLTRSCCMALIYPWDRHYAACEYSCIAERHVS